MRRSPLPVIVLLVAALGCAVAAYLAASGSVHGGRPVAADRTPLLSARRAPALLAASVGDPALRAVLDQIVAAGPQATCVSVSVDGRQVYSHQPDLPVPPASNQKLVTATVALEILGADHRFRTSVVGAAPKGGTVNGDLHLVGGGDPVLSTKAFTAHYPDQPAVGTSLEKLADAVVASGVHHVTGRILGDESRYDTLRTVPTWPARFAGQHQTGPLSALTVNDGFTSFPEHETEQNRLEVEATTDPAGYAASTLTELLRQRGVQVDGGSGTGVAPAGAHQVAHIDSPRLSAIVGHMLTESDNEVAELLVKELGHQRAGSGTTMAGLTVVRDAVRALGLPTTGVTMHDGSGLDYDDRLTCGFLAALLHRIGSHGPIASGLAVAGESGTLRDRFTEAPTKGRIRAKTGTLNDVTALSGFAHTQQGQEVTFAYVATGDEVGPILLGLQDQLGTGLVTYPAGVTVTKLSPVGS
jgi:D-alanyl-D-alanine carboxypeptidase/D-alanyl-D-alanine-endopeptidase (penicillin-binding protein 4)